MQPSSIILPSPFILCHQGLPLRSGPALNLYNTTLETSIKADIHVIGRERERGGGGGGENRRPSRAYLYQTILFLFKTKGTYIGAHQQGFSSFFRGGGRDSAARFSLVAAVYPSLLPSFHVRRRLGDHDLHWICFHSLPCRSFPYIILPPPPPPPPSSPPFLHTDCCFRNADFPQCPLAAFFVTLD